MFRKLIGTSFRPTEQRNAFILKALKCFQALTGQKRELVEEGKT